MRDTLPFVPDFRVRLRGGEFLLGTWLTLPDPVVAEILSGAGFDFLVADGEHGPLATDDLVRLSIATRAAGVPLLYRVGANEPVRIMHALDSGASGVVIPQVRSVADVERAVAWCRYPPTGLRGVAPRRVSNYGRDTAAYLAAANELVTCCIQVETAESVEHIDDLLAVPGVDALLIGPNDLAAALGHLGDIEHPDVEAAIDHVLTRAIAAGVPAGAWTPSATVTMRRRGQGFRFTTVGSDSGFLVSAADAVARDVKGPEAGSRAD